MFRTLIILFVSTSFLYSCVDKATTPVLSKQKQALSSTTQKPVLPTQVKAKLQAWRKVHQKREKRTLLQQRRARIHQRWQSRRAWREARRLRMLQRARNIRSQLVKIKAARK